MTTLNDKLYFAQRYCKRNFRLFPVDENRSPYVKWGEAATWEYDIVARWLRRWPTADLAIALPPELMVVDIDVKRGPNGFESFTQLAGVHPDDLDTWQMTTSSGGRHVWFETDGHGFTNTHDRLGPGLDTRAVGGMVVVAPATGRRWLKTRNLMLAPQWLKAALPEVIITHVNGKRSKSHTRQGVSMLHVLCKKIRTAKPGDRNYARNNCAYVAGGYVAGGELEENDAWDQICMAYYQQGHPGNFDVAKGERWVRDAFMKGMRVPINFDEVDEKDLEGDVEAFERAMEIRK